MLFVALGAYLAARRILLPALTPVVMLLQIAEAALCLDILRNTGRWKDYIAGLLVRRALHPAATFFPCESRFILKYLLLEVMIYLAEGLGSLLKQKVAFTTPAAFSGLLLRNLF